MTGSVAQDRYKGWLVSFDHPPIPCRQFDWSATHSDYDGAEDSSDDRVIQASTRAELIAAIDAWTDDAAVEAFADKMKAKMADSRVKGREGWDDPARCSPDVLKRLMYAHAEKGDPVGVANLCMMLDHYGASTALGEPFPQPKRRDGKEPCGECHLPVGEICDICGASWPEDLAAMRTPATPLPRVENVR